MLTVLFIDPPARVLREAAQFLHPPGWQVTALSAGEAAARPDRLDGVGVVASFSPVGDTLLARLERQLSGRVVRSPESSRLPWVPESVCGLLHGFLGPRRRRSSTRLPAIILDEDRPVQGVAGAFVGEQVQSAVPGSWRITPRFLDARLLPSATVAAFPGMADAFLRRHRGGLLVGDSLMLAETALFLHGREDLPREAFFALSLTADGVASFARELAAAQQRGADRTTATVMVAATSDPGSRQFEWGSVEPPARWMEPGGARCWLACEARTLPAAIKIWRGWSRDREDATAGLPILVIPSLADRPEDIPRLAEMELRALCRSLHLQSISLSRPAALLLADIPWPEGLMGLRRLLRALVGVNRGGVVQVSDIRRHLAATVHSPTNSHGLPIASSTPSDGGTEGIAQAFARDALAKPPQAGGNGLLNDALDQVAKQFVQTAMELHMGNKLRAAEQLGISRNTLKSYLERLGYDLPGRGPGRPRREEP